MGFIAARLLAVALLVLAPAQWPYGYFTLLRFVVTGVAAYSVFASIRTRKSGWAWPMGALVLLFNPFYIVQLDRATWLGVDLATALFMIGSLFFLQQEKPSRPTEAPVDESDELRKHKWWNRLLVAGLAVLLLAVATSVFGLAFMQVRTAAEVAQVKSEAAGQIEDAEALADEAETSAADEVAAAERRGMWEGYTTAIALVYDMCGLKPGRYYVVKVRKVNHAMHPQAGETWPYAGDPSFKKRLVVPYLYTEIRLGRRYRFNADLSYTWWPY